jgi:hypothetical protein
MWLSDHPLIEIPTVNGKEAENLVVERVVDAFLKTANKDPKNQGLCLPNEA